MLRCITTTHKKTYVGYTKNIDKRLTLHNLNKGAKFTKGNKWKVIYKKRFILKTKAMSYEYELKNDKKKRLDIYNNS
jgi:putative endonuclease